MSRVQASGLDIGLLKDRTVLAGVGIHAPTGLVCVGCLETWAPRPGVKVDLTAVEADVAALALAFGAPVVLDPWQGVLLGQRLAARGVAVIEYPFTADSRRRLFGTLLDLIRTGRLRSRPHDDLRRELLGLEVQESAAGWRVDHRAGRHDDHVIALALAIAGLAGADAPPVEPTGEERAVLAGLARLLPGWAGAEAFPDDNIVREEDDRDSDYWRVR